MISLISSIKIIKVVICKAKFKGWRFDPNNFSWIAASIADAAALNPNGIKTPLANGLSLFAIKGNPVFSNCPKGM